MKQYLTLLKLEFLNSSRRTKRGAKAFSIVLKIVLGLVVFGVFVGLMLFAFDGVLSMAKETNLEGEFLIFFVLMAQVVQLLFGVGITTKTLFFSPDEDKLKLPVSGTAIIFSKITYLFIKELVFAFVLGLPVLILFGVKTGAGAGFYCMIPVDIFLMSLIPFFLSMLLSIPTMYVVSFLRNKFIIMICLYVVFVAAGFYVYSALLKLVLTILQTSDYTSLLGSSLIESIKNVASHFYIQVLFRNIATLKHFLASFFVYLSICFFLGGLVYLFAKKWYYKILISNLESPTGAFKKSTKVVSMSPTRALFKREFLNIFRSVNYSFQYLTIAITTPLMVYFSSSIATNIGVSKLGTGILPGIAVLILIMFLSVGSSFAASSVTREGENFFHSKIIPVSFTKQITVKFLMYCLVIIPSTLISCIVLFLAGFLSIGEAMTVFGGVGIVMIGNIAKSIDIDIKKPKFIYVGSKEMVGTNSNISASLSIGFIIATILGVSGIILSIFVSISASTLVLFAFSIPFCIIEVLRLFVGLEKKYQRIEV